VVSTPLKNVKGSWDYYSQYMEKIKKVPNRQPVLICLKQWGWNKKTCSETFESLVIL
jgi:hypothetical protein